MAASQTGSVLERTVLKEGQIFLVADRAGDIKALNLEGHGLYYRDTRHLSLFEMDVTGTRLILLSASGELNFMSNLQFANDTLIGSITDADLKVLTDALEEESTVDQDYYIDRATIDVIGDGRASEHLMGLLRTALGTEDGVDIRWQRR